MRKVSLNVLEFDKKADIFLMNLIMTIQNILKN